MRSPLLLLAAGATGCGRPESVAAPPPPAISTVHVETWDDQVAALDGRLTAAIAAAERPPADWGRWETVASLYTQRARLTGDYADYVAAQGALDRGFSAAPAGSGPVLSQAKLNYTLHRLDAAEVGLNEAARRPLLDEPKRSGLALFRGDIALERGQFGVAKADFDDAASLHPSFQTDCALARYAWQTGDYEAAEAHFDDALARWHGVSQEPVAWLHLQGGLMDLDRGRYAEALADYQAADAALPGYWLVGEHIAEVTALMGDVDGALARYGDLIARTGNPEFMDAAAALRRERGEEGAAKTLIAQAEAAHRARMALAPEAAMGHALEHWLQFGEDPQETLAMAEANYAARPGGAATVQLATALLAAGRAGDAQGLIDALLATPYRSAALFAVSADIEDALGATELAAERRAAAKSINPQL